MPSVFHTSARPAAINTYKEARTSPLAKIAWKAMRKESSVAKIHFHDTLMFKAATVGDLGANDALADKE